MICEPEDHVGPNDHVGPEGHVGPKLVITSHPIGWVYYIMPSERSNNDSLHTSRSAFEAKCSDFDAGCCKVAPNSILECCKNKKRRRRGGGNERRVFWALDTAQNLRKTLLCALTLKQNVANWFKFQANCCIMLLVVVAPTL